MHEKRVVFDFDIQFTNGGGLQGQDFRLDIAGDDISDEELASSIIQDLRLLMVGAVRITRKMIIAEPHKRTPPAPGSLSTLVYDLRQEAYSLDQLLAHAANTTIRIIGGNGESYLLKRAAD